MTGALAACEGNQHTEQYNDLETVNEVDLRWYFAKSYDENLVTSFVKSSYRQDGYQTADAGRAEQVTKDGAQVDRVA